MTTHWIKDANVGPTEITTHCGMVAKRQPRDRATQYRTSYARDIEADKSLAEVDCKSCLRSAKRISETCTTNPRGNHRRRVA